MSVTKLLRDAVKKRKQTLSTTRFQIQQKLFSRFGEGCIPRLWTPPLCHYKLSPTKECIIDLERNSIHLNHLSDFLGGYLINGSTGDGWTLTADQRISNLRGTLDLMNSVSVSKPVLLGVLEHDYNQKVLSIKKYIDFMNDYLYSDDTEEDIVDMPVDALYELSPFVGFVLTPLSNTDNQREIEECFAEIISGHPEYPFILYQLPQITNSEMSIETVINLVSRFGNITMIKDSSGTDALLKSGRSMDGVFMVRGSEGQYVESMLNLNHGVASYHGLLLSTANNYPQHLCAMMKGLENGHWSEAAKISEMISAVCQETFEVVRDNQFGNPFTNSAKMVDFWMANGCGGRAEIMLKNRENLPLSHCGHIFDASGLIQVRDILISNGVLEPESKGYLQHSRLWWKEE